MQIITRFNDKYIKLVSLDKAQETSKGVYLLAKNPDHLTYDSNKRKLSYFQTSITISLDDITPAYTEWLPELAIAMHLLPQFPEIKDIYLQCIKYKYLRR